MKAPYFTFNRHKRWYDGLSRPMARLVRYSVVLFIAIFLLVGVVIGIYFWRASAFNLDEVPKRIANTQAYTHDNQYLGPLFNRRGAVVEYGQLPTSLVAALIAREDESFFSHNGVDVWGMLRATMRNLKDWSFTQGGSTLSMQLARNTFDLKAKTLDRKILEMAIALRLENRFNKQEILESYLNKVYFGAGAYGIADASLTFFNKSVSELNLPESALLVGIVRGPSIYNPFANKSAAMKQKDETLERLYDAGYISSEEWEVAKNMPLQFASNDTGQQPSYPLQGIKRELESIPREIPEESLGDTGLEIVTSIDLRIQKHVEKTTELALRAMEKNVDWKLPSEKNVGEQQFQAAVMVIQPSTGDIIATIGGRDSFSAKNLWMDVSRPLGNLMMPIVNTAVSDKSQFIVANNPYQSSQGIGDEPILDLLKTLKFEGNLPRGRALAEGKFSQPLIKVIPMLLALYHGGYAPSLHFITQATTSNGVEMYKRDHPQLTKTSPILPPDAARVAVKFAPFVKDERRKITSVHSVMEDNKGVFVATLHSSCAVFIWMGQIEPTSELYESPATKKLIVSTLKSLNDSILAQLINMPQEEIVTKIEPVKEVNAESSVKSKPSKRRKSKASSRSSKSKRG